MALKQTNPENTTLNPGIFTAKEDRLLSLDALRGLIMILMAIDHAAFFIAKVHPGEYWGLALPRYPGIIEFLTRWLSHLCAPGFFFLMGAGMFLFAASRSKAGWTGNKIMRFFIIRGLFLILLQHMVENPAWLLGTLGELPKMMVQPPGGGGEVMLHFGVLYGLGANMIVFALLLRANPALIAIISAGSILATQVLTPGATQVEVLYTPVQRLILIPGHTDMWQVLYPLLPWMGITGFGIIFAGLLLKNREKVFRYTPVVGVVFLITFVILRWQGGFGNFHAPANDWISFLNLTKYPPSLSFILLTLGINLLLLYLFFRTKQLLPRIGRPLLIFGRSALFFYLVHLYLYAIIGIAFPGGTSYQLMYLIWLIGLSILYPLCLRYGTFKRKKPIESVWKFF